MWEALLSCRVIPTHLIFSQAAACTNCYRGTLPSADPTYGAQGQQDAPAAATVHAARSGPRPTGRREFAASSGGVSAYLFGARRLAGAGNTRAVLRARAAELFRQALLENNDAAAVLSARQRLKALVDLLEPVAPGDQAVDVDLPAQVQVDQLVKRRVGAG